MHSLFTWIAFGLGTLFVGACVVAWWEHLGRNVKRTEEPDWDAEPHPIASVDVELDDLTAASPATAVGDVGERRQALGGAMMRMTSGDRRHSFDDTVPMILAGGPSDATEISAEDAAGFATGNASLAEARQRARATASD
jgi:hypothetical protein